MVPDLPPRDGTREEPPPFGRSWTVLYLIVLANLAVWIGIFTVFTRAWR
jgi:hypothetical protein